MPTSVTVNDLKINELTEAQYDVAVQGGVIGENELSVITDMESLPDQTGNAGKFLTTDGTDASWASVTKVNTTATLAVADWSSSTQTITVSGVKADSVVFVSPAPASASDYASAGILCTAQAADSLTFTATTTPSSDISVNIICL